MKQTHKWDDDGEEEEEEEGIEIILPEIVSELFTSNEAWIQRERQIHYFTPDRIILLCSSTISIQMKHHAPIVLCLSKRCYLKCDEAQKKLLITLSDFPVLTIVWYYTRGLPDLKSQSRPHLESSEE